MVEFSSVLVREEAKFIPATLKRVQYFEHVYECRACKNDSLKKSQIKRGQAPKGAIQRSIAGPTVLAKLIYDKFAQYLPPYRQVNECSRHGLLTNDKNLSNWIIRVATDWLQPVYELMKKRLIAKSVLHIDETFAQILKRSDGKPAQSNAYNWVARSVQNEGPVIILFKSALSRGRATLEDFIQGFKGTVICDGYSAYNHLPDVQFANCWAHVRRYWLKADSNNGRKGVQYCDQLFHIERKIKHLSPEERVKIRQQESKPIVDEFFEWVDHSPFFGKNALAKANGIDFYQYLVKLMTDLSNLPFQQQPEILERYLPWSEDIQATCRK